MDVFENGYLIFFLIKKKGIVYIKKRVDYYFKINKKKKFIQANANSWHIAKNHPCKIV